ncbi:MAG: DNA-formamidopyrimidine glycosylase [Erysipelotrichaceae bacterium]|nr:DNA-formamidopyrimidine glycosylase [Erysipelotrichaceae bacterium]
MPELPEVQTVLDTLALRIKDRAITDIRILYKPIVSCSEKRFKQSLIGQHFRTFKRRGKYLLFEMDDLTLVSHLRMEGKYYILDEKTPISKHDHVIFVLDDGKQLRYNDVRKFGRMELIEKDEEYENFKDLGPEPFSDKFNLEYCRDYLKNKKTPIKTVLLDQSFVAGIGNIYADEILFAMKIDPRSRADLLDDKEIRTMIHETGRILNEAIQAGGTTIRSYTSSLGVTGLFQLDLMVHTIDNCPICHTKIQKTVIGGRGTYYCPNCQKLKKQTRIAITGSIGSGKSEVSRYLREKGYTVFDCDEENRNLLEKGNAGYEAVKKTFPECINNGELDKKALSSLVFNDASRKKELEDIMHPLILERLNEHKEELLFAEVPLLFEARWDRYFDQNLLIVTNQKILLERLKNRSMSKSEALRRLKKQMSVSEKKKRADKIIYNNGSLQELHSSLEEWLQEIRC